MYSTAPLFGIWSVELLLKVMGHLEYHTWLDSCNKEQPVEFHSLDVLYCNRFPRDCDYALNLMENVNDLC